MPGSVRLLLLEPGADPVRLDLLASFLRHELRQLDVAEVAAAPARVPPGARAVDAAVVGGLLVTLGDSAGQLAAVVATIRDWLRRSDRTDRRVRVELGGEELELSAATSAEQEQIVRLFIARHTPRGD